MKRIIIFSVLCAVLNLTSCFNGLNETYEEQLLTSDNLNPFASAENPGDVVSVTAGSVTFNISYVNNSTGIVFPTGASDTGTAVISRKIFMGQTTVTNALFATVLQWAKDNNRIVESSGSHNEVNTTTVKYGTQVLIDLSGYSVKISYSSGTFSVVPGCENYPVVFASWYGAIMFCNWLTEMCDGNTDNIVYTNIPTNGTWNASNNYSSSDDSKTGYRLPSNNELEYAARYLGTKVPTEGNLATEFIAQGVNGGSASLTAGYYWTPGDYASGAKKDITDFTECDAVAWFGNRITPGIGNTTSLQPVARKRANALGIYDMSGNITQWSFNASGVGRNLINNNWKSAMSNLFIYIHSTTSTPSSMFDNMGFRIVKTK